MRDDYVHIATDLETWGKRVGCDARSIGAALFDIDTGTIEDQFHVAVDNPLRRNYNIDKTMSAKQLDLLCGEHRKYNLLRDEDTVAWWYDQSHELWQAFVDPVDLKIGCEQFSGFLLSHSNDVRDGVAHDVALWGHGAAFDPPILEALFLITEVKVPWFYRAPRDTRTAFDFAGIDDHSKWLKDHQQGLLHHAMWDSISEAKAISNAWRKAKGLELIPVSKF